MDRLEGELQAPRPSLPRRRVPLREDEDRLAGVPRLRPGCAPPRCADPVPADARGRRLGAVRRSEVAVRTEAGRDPRPRGDGDRWHGVPDSQGPRRHLPVPGPPHDPRAGRPGERGARRRDRGRRRRRPDVVRDPPAADEPAERAGDQTRRQADPGRVRGVRPAVAGRPRDDRAVAWKRGGSCWS